MPLETANIMVESKNKNIIWGYHPVREALAAKRRSFETLYLARTKNGRRTQELESIAANDRLSLWYPPHLPTWIQWPDMDDIRGLLPRYLLTLTALWRKFYPNPRCKGRAHFILLLDQLMDPQNFGAIARTAYCTGVQGIIMTQKRSTPVSPAAVKASAGALEHLHVAYVTNLVNAVKTLKQSGVWVVGADRSGSQNLFQADLSVSLGLVIGGEEKGIRPLVKQHCDFLIAIPQIGSIQLIERLFCRRRHPL